MSEKVSADVTRELWDRKAAYWDQRFGEGNDFHRTLVEPATLRLLDVRPGMRLLDIATGNGAFARALAARGAQVTAFDFSPVFIERAQARSTEYGDRIEYRVLDATDEESLAALPGPFAGAVANMALMDMADIAPLAHTLPRLLGAGAPFVFSIQHPCFNSNGTALRAEERLDDEGFRMVAGMVVSRYLDVPPGIGPGMPGEPNGHYYFHRPLSQILGTFFTSGFVLDGLEEPAFEHAARPLTWESVGGQIPPVLVCRLQFRGML